MKTVQVDIVTPERTVFEGEAEMVIAKGADGELGVLAGHIPLVTPLKIAPIRIKQSDGELQLAISGGFLEVRPDKVTVLAETAERAEEIDVDRAQEAKARAEQKLQSLDPSDPEYEEYQQDLQKAETRLQVAKS